MPTGINGLSSVTGYKFFSWSVNFINAYIYSLKSFLEPATSRLAARCLISLAFPRCLDFPRTLSALLLIFIVDADAENDANNCKIQRITWYIYMAYYIPPHIYTIFHSSITHIYQERIELWQKKKWGMGMNSPPLYMPLICICIYLYIYTMIHQVWHNYWLLHVTTQNYSHSPPLQYAYPPYIRHWYVCI